MAKINQYKPQIAFHPGETLDEKLQEMGMGPKEFAIRTSKPEKTITAILKGESSITPEMAILFESVLKIPAHFWLNMQRNYDEYMARKERMELLKESERWAKQFPYADMVNKGWVSKQKTVEEKTSELFSFFGISSHTAWENYYLNQKLKVGFRISLAHTKEPHAISAWLRKGELQAAKLETKPYDSRKFKSALPKIKEIMAKQPKDFFSQLQTICSDAGVKIVYTPCVKKAPINGSTRWINNNPLIQLSGRYKRNDIFWFTFFHEAGHIILHGKKDIFLENIDYSDYDKEKEKEADCFAEEWTFSKEEEELVMKNKTISEKEIVDYANKFKTHPAIIIGRLQHNKVIPHSVGRGFFEPITFE